MACFYEMEASKVLIYLIMTRYTYVKGGKVLKGIFIFVPTSPNNQKNCPHWKYEQFLEDRTK